MARKRFPCRDGFLEVRDGKVFLNGKTEVTDDVENYSVRDPFGLRRALRNSPKPEPFYTVPEPAPLVDEFAPVEAQEAGYADLG